MKEAKGDFTAKPDTNPFAEVDSVVHCHNLDLGSAILILQQIQSRLGHVSPLMLQRVSQLTGIPASTLYSIVTFYAQFRLEPVGENLIQVCHGTACHLAGAEKISEAIELESKTKSGHTSADGKFTVETVACLGCCSLGPVVNVNEETMVRLTPEEARKIVKQKREGCSCHRAQQSRDAGEEVSPDE
ncbi:MAG TPA: NAD(P)H-dependent oxidoreductase subunit E [Bacillota bacterium]|nr:NAD(P)H-dependent oxidoreductase subunit E [Bacillota bacterium]